MWPEERHVDGLRGGAAVRHIRVARDVAQANADGVLREVQHDVIGIDNMM